MDGRGRCASRPSLRPGTIRTRKPGAANLEPLAKTIVARLKDFLPKLASPIRTGVHPNTAFALGEALDYARAAGDAELAALVARRAREYYEHDRACPLAYEPSGEDFFSPCLEEADLMRRVMPQAEFAKWLRAFLPGLAAGKPFPLSPAVVTDPTDPRLVHLDGLEPDASVDAARGRARVARVGRAPEDPREGCRMRMRRPASPASRRETTKANTGSRRSRCTS